MWVCEGMSFKNRQPTIEYLCLGCDKNLVDLEKLLAHLKNLGAKIVPAEKGADVLLINTCAFIEPARRESIEHILASVERKKEGEVKYLVVIGCLVELYEDELKKEIPEVDLWVKYSELNQLSQKLKSIIPLKPKTKIQALRLPITPRHISYLKISEGCDRGCTFCVIPKIRGRFRSLPLNELITEAKFLENKGVKELNLVAQDLCDYGKDIGTNLLELLENLLAHTSIPWLRLFYLNPENFDFRLTKLMEKEPRILPYFDLPFQHISDRILARMGRSYRGKDVKAIMESIRSTLPNAVIRATVMVGFPGEEESDFNELLKFIEWAEIDWLGVFTFSAEPFAPASRFKNRPAKSIAEKRKEELELLWQEILESKNQRKIGEVYQVLVDQQGEIGYDFKARSFEQAYEIDGVVFLKGNFRTGKFYQVEIVDSLGIDLIGVKQRRRK